MDPTSIDDDILDDSVLRSLFFSANYEEILEKTMHHLENPRLLYWYIRTALELGKTDQCEKELSTFEEKVLGHSLQSDTILDPYHRAQLLLISGIFYAQIGKDQLGVTSLKMASQIFQDLNDGNGIIRSLVELNGVELANGNIALALEKLAKASSYLNQDIDVEVRALLLNSWGILLGEHGDFEQEKAKYLEALELFQEIGYYDGMGRILNNLGAHYWYIGDIFQAKEYYERTLEIAQQTHNDGSIAIALFNIGVVMQDLNKFEEAERYYLESLEKYISYNNPRDLAEVYHYLLELYISMENQDKAKKIKERISKLENREDIPSILLRNKYSDLIYVKTFGRHSDQMRCIPDFREIIAFNDFDHDILIRSIKHLIELLIVEYQNGKQQEVYDDIETYMKLLFKTAMNKKMKREIIFTMVLQSKLALISQDIEKAYLQLELAQSYIEKHKLRHFSNWIEEEFDNLQENLEIWRDLAKQTSRMNKMEELHILDYLKNVVKYQMSTEEKG